MCFINMVASLQHKKEALEAKIRDKTDELRKLCIEEAELTGFLPAETPLQPGESPPQFRRRVGTSFTYPESLINKLKSKEDEALAELELECKVQTGIAEASLGIANDPSTNKAVRRRHQILYEKTQRRLSELETRLNVLRLSQPKQKKKPRPQTEIENDCTDGGDADNLSDHVRFHKNVNISLHESGSDKYNNIMKTSHSFAGFQKSDPNIHPYQRVAQSNMSLPHMMFQNMDHRHSVMVPEFHHNIIRSSNPSPNGSSEGWWNKSREIAHGPSTRQSPHMLINAQDFYVDAAMVSDRFGSLDRNPQPLIHHEHDNRISSTLPRNVFMNQGANTSILLPSQTYPENSLMRTQSLGNVDPSKQHPERKAKEKEWYESCLDSSPPKVTPKVESPVPTSLSEGKLLSTSFENNNTKMNQASINSIQFDTVVPYESPKNHTVVQAGKWQPYREVTKPFEMSDFYKYSTKFRKGQNHNQDQSHDISSSQQQLQQQQEQAILQYQLQQQQEQVLQQHQLQQQQLLQHQQHLLQLKGIYKPLQRLECQPLQQNSFSGDMSLKVSPQGISPQIDSRYPEEIGIGWYREKSSSPKPRSSTLV